MHNLLNHAKLGFCLWDIIPAILIIVVIVLFVIRLNRMKKEELSLVEKLRSFEAEEASSDEKQ